MWDAFKSWLAGDAAAEVAALRFVFGVPLGVFAAVLLLAGAAGAVVFFYWPKLDRVPQRDRVLLTALRAAAVLLVLFLLLDPCLVGERKQPGEQVVALLFDDSQSMNIAGIDGQSRGERLAEAYELGGADFEEQLERRFAVVRYAFGRGVERADSVGGLRFQENVSDLTGAVEGAVRDLAGAEIAAVVLFSDGVQQPDTGRDTERLAALGVPVFTVGADTQAPWRDVELASISVKRTNFDQSPVVVTAHVTAEGLDRERVIVEVLDNGRVVASEPLVLAGGAGKHEARLEFIPARKGWLSFEARVRHADTGPADRLIAAQNIALPDKDRVVQNNTRGFLVDNREQTYRILYLCGSPAWENKFLRRALQEDKQLNLTSLIRVSRAEKKFVFRGKKSSVTNPLFEGFDDEPVDQPRYDEAVFLRMGVHKSELAKGYPNEADELFEYDLVIWGDIEHHFFSTEQLKITRAFVEKRGGALLLTGGPRSFAEGGFGGTIIDGMLPIVLRAVRDGSRTAASMAPFAAAPTIDGMYNGAWSLDPDATRNRELWRDMEGLFGLNAFPLTRAGASVMARVDAKDPAYDGQPFFAVQRYGAGRCAVLATGETWRWKMAAPDGDTRHQRLWRQIVRSLVDAVPEPVTLRNKADAYGVGDPVDLEAFVRNKRFEPRDGLRVTFQMTTPAGDTLSLPVEESIRETGIYSSRFVPGMPGDYTLVFTALDDKDEVVGTMEERLSVAPDLREFLHARYDGAFLETLARVTGGRSVALENLEQLAGEIPWRAKETSEADLFRQQLWYWPPFLAVLAVLFSCEWYLRRRRGQA